MIQIYERDDIDQFVKRFETRRQEIPQKVTETVRDILIRIKEEGDRAVVQFTQQYDKVRLSEADFAVTPEEMDQAVSLVPKTFLEILNQSAQNINKYHQKCKHTSWMTWENHGILLGQKITPLQRIGIYVPGGRAVYPSSLLMAAIPAQVAGVKEIVIVSPPQSNGQIHPTILATAHILNIHEIYKIGGAQAIGCLAIGTQSIKSVDKIVGPGNIYVAEAKRQVYGIVDIDMIAGPSEVVILADDTANPDFIASDLLAQAEHDPLASSICITWSKNLSHQVIQSIEKQAQNLTRKEIFRTALKSWGGIILTKNLDEALQWVNRLAPEHLGLHVQNGWDLLDRIRNSGAIFIGSFSPETVGDYWAGPNHILPTNATARFASPLDTDDFMKKSSLIGYTKTALEKEGKYIIKFAEMEGLDGHANAVRQRID